MAAVEFDRITCSFAARGRATGSYTAVKDVTLSIAEGEFVSVVGPTGCGKSTLLNVAAGLLRPTSGELRVEGKPLAGINRRAGYMFKSEALMLLSNAKPEDIIGADNIKKLADLKNSVPTGGIFPPNASPRRGL